MDVSQGFPVPNAPLLDSHGQLTDAWRRFFLTLWNRTGEGPGISSADLELLISLILARVDTTQLALSAAQSAALRALTPATARNSQALDVALMALLKASSSTGGGTIRRLTAGANITLTPSPIVDSGTVAVTQGTALSVFGVAGNATADHADIAAGSDKQVLRRNGTAIGFGAIDISSSSAVSGTLAVGNGGTGQTSYTNGQLLIGNTTGNTLTKATLTQGSGITITNGSGSITITASGVIANSGGLIGRQVITATGAGTYTPTSGTTYVIIELQAGGGGSGGVATAGASKVSLSGAGGGGEWIQVKLTSNFSGASYSVGAGGTAGSSGNNAGGNGGNTTFTDTAGSPTTYTAHGGVAGAGGGGQTAPNFSISGAGGNGGNGDIVQSGQPGLPGSALFSTGGYAGAGGSSHYSGGGAGSFVASANSSQSGAAPNGYGGGGGGCSNTGTAGNLAGIAGSQGLIVIWEYS